MSAKMIIPQAEADQGFGLLKDIVEMVKNPQAIDEAYERRRKAAQMTDDEVAKAADARALIAQSDSLKVELKQREDSLALDKSTHVQSVAEFEKRTKSFSQTMLDKNNELAAITAQHADTDARHIAERQALDDRAKKIEADHAEWQRKCENVQLGIAQGIAANENEAARLASWERKLKAKAARLAAEAQSEA